MIRPLARYGTSWTLSSSCQILVRSEQNSLRYKTVAKVYIEQCEPGLVFWLIEELLDSQTLDGCRTVFDYLDSRRERLTAVSNASPPYPYESVH